MWAQTWENAFKIVSPFSNVTNPLDEVNEALVEQVQTFEDIFLKLYRVFKGWWHQMTLSI